MQTGRTENANANAKRKCAKKCNLQGKKKGSRQKKAVQNGSNFFSGAGSNLSFQDIKCKNFCQEKAGKCQQKKKNVTYKGKKPLQKKKAKKKQLHSKKC